MAEQKKKPAPRKAAKKGLTGKKVVKKAAAKTSGRKTAKGAAAGKKIAKPGNSLAKILTAEGWKRFVMGSTK